MFQRGNGLFNLSHNFQKVPVFCAQYASQYANFPRHSALTKISCEKPTASRIPAIRATIAQETLRHGNGNKVSPFARWKPPALGDKRSTPVGGRQSRGLLAPADGHPERAFALHLGCV